MADDILEFPQSMGWLGIPFVDPQSLRRSSAQVLLLMKKRDAPVLWLQGLKLIITLRQNKKPSSLFTLLEDPVVQDIGRAVLVG